MKFLSNLGRFNSIYEYELIISSVFRLIQFVHKQCVLNLWPENVNKVSKISRNLLVFLNSVFKLTDGFSDHRIHILAKWICAIFVRFNDVRNCHFQFHARKFYSRIKSPKKTQFAYFRLQKKEKKKIAGNLQRTIKIVLMDVHEKPGQSEKLWAVFLSCCVLKDTFDRELMRSFVSVYVRFRADFVQIKTIRRFITCTEDKSNRLLYFSLYISNLFWKSVATSTLEMFNMRNQTQLFKKKTPAEWKM